MERNNDYIIRTAFKRYMIPMVVSSISPNLCASIDKAIVGNMLGQDSLAAVGLVMPISVLISVLSLLFALGAGNICTLHNSRGEEEQTNQTFSLAIMSTFLAALILAVFGLIFLSPLVRLLGGEGVLFNDTSSYTRILLFGLPVMVVCMAFDFFLRVDGTPNIIVVGMLIANITNIILDIVLIKAGMGVAGAALATVLGYLFTLIFYCIHFFSKRCSLKFITGGSAGKIIGKSVFGGIGSVIQFSGWLASIIIINNLLMRTGGERSVAVYAVVLSISIFTASAFNGAINAVTPLAGTFYGDRDYQSLHRAMGRGTGIAYCFGGFMAILYLCIPSALAKLFGVSDPATLTESVVALRIVSGGIFIQIAVGILSSYYQATEKSGVATIMSFTRAGALQPFLPLILVPVMGTNGVFLSLVLMEAGGLLAGGVGIALYRRKNPGTRGILLLEPLEEGREFRKMIPNEMDKLSGLVDGVLSFCRDNGLDERRTYISGLAVEEMVRNIIEYGFVNSKKAHYIDIRIKLNGDQLILRLRDDGILFNPTETGILPESEDKRLHLGIRMVSSMAKKMEYTRVLGFNNLVVYA